MCVVHDFRHPVLYSNHEYFPRWNAANTKTNIGAGDLGPLARCTLGIFWKHRTILRSRCSILDFVLYSSPTSTAVFFVTIDMFGSSIRIFFVLSQSISDKNSKRRGLKITFPRARFYTTRLGWVLGVAELYFRLFPCFFRKANTALDTMCINVRDHIPAAAELQQKPVAACVPP